jgi:predicted kinase
MRVPTEHRTVELVIFIGLQASGKTSFYRHRFADSHVHVSKDSFPKSRNRERRQNRLIQEALEAGNSVVLDNTNPSQQTRAPAIDIARSCGARLVGFYFESRLLLSEERNSQRVGPARVPDVALRATASQLQLPTQEEGFAELWYVSIREGQFLVKPWTEIHEDG